MKKETLALYCGTFSPFHIGHLNILEKAEAIFGKENVITCVGRNPNKAKEYYSAISTLKAFENRETIVYSGFTHKLIEGYENIGYNVVLIRGLRNGDDLAYEDNQLRYMKDFKPNIKCIFIRCDEEFEHISSSSIRALEEFQEGSANKYLVK